MRLTSVCIILFFSLSNTVLANTVEEVLGKEKVYSILVNVFQKWEIEQVGKGLFLEPGSLREIEKHVLSTKAPKINSERWLKNGFSKFLKDYRNFLLNYIDDFHRAHPEETWMHYGPEKKLLAPILLLRSFLQYQSKRCGEIPCSVPPCCGDECDPCSNRR